jgi:putative ABC transport system substrate-binding protein
MATMLAVPRVGAAQQAGKMYRIASILLLDSVERAKESPNTKALLEGLAQLGFVEGRNLIFDLRSADGDVNKFRALLDDVLRLRPDVFYFWVCAGPFTLVRQRVTSVPIVVGACNDDLVAQRIVGSLSRPGGNITGQSKVTPELAAKRLSLAKELPRSTKRVAVLWNPNYADFAADWQATRAIASALSIVLEGFPIYKEANLDPAFTAIARFRPDVLVTFSDPVIHGAAKRVAELAAAHRIPAIYAFREVPDVGGLMSYGPNLPTLFRNSAKYVARILNGAHAGDIPIEQASKFELVINLKTARALNLSIPQSLLLRADDVIQ